MKIPSAVLLTCTLGCLSLVSCQSTRPLPKKVAQPQIQAPPATAPAWTRATKSGEVRNGRMVRFATKVIEVTRIEGEDLPRQTYRKTMNQTELAAYLRGVMEQKGTDLMTSPSVTTLEGRSGQIKVGREFAYPETEGDASKMKQEFVGFTNSVRARPASNRKKLVVDVFAQVKNFEGFDGANSERPVFSTRTLSSSAELASGETMVLGGLVSREEQEVEDSIPILGDLPLLGAAFRDRHTQTFWKELIVVVTPTVVDR